MILLLGLAFLMLGAKSALVMWLWNLVAVPMFNAPHMSFWMAFGLVWLVSLLIPNRKDK